jgi:molybdopterin-guanine dinucleotide biosynthesis protein A
MGTDKARLRLRGEVLWRRQMRVLSEAGATPVVVVRRDDQAKLGRGDVRIVHDTFVGAGPLAGLQAALSAAGEARWIAVLAVDMPAIDAAWFRRLRRACAAGCGAVGRHADGFEPLAAIYPREALAVVTRRLERGQRAMQDLVRALLRARRMTVVEIGTEERTAMANWNSPGDRILRRGVPPG